MNKKRTELANHINEGEFLLKILIKDNLLSTIRTIM